MKAIGGILAALIKLIILSLLCLSLNAEDMKNLDTLKATYGAKFGQLSDGEKEYLNQNFKVLQRITQAVLNRYGRSRIPLDVITNDRNMIEFHLHPDGSISDISFIQKSKIDILNDTTRETIELAYSKYPRPKEKILIRYRVHYNLDQNLSKVEK